ncbi:MAG: hypothetical protein U9N34_04220, partial [Candidatus Cloacimonadota bacterium]|nr:hypothetical protein [Candidatus Cloacimonadota bacterium]
MKKLFFFIILTFAIHLFSNDSEDKIFIIEDATFHSNDISELLQFYRYNPIEVNFCTPTKLLELPWLDKEIIEKLVKYRKQKMISNRKDLIEIGFDKITIKEISPYITYTKQMTKHLFSRTYYSFQEKHKDEISPYKSYQKIQYRFSNITLGGQIQKDISEINYFDYYSYYLWLHDYKYVKNFIVGKYRLAFGQGILFSPALGAKKTSATT